MTKLKPLALQTTGTDLIRVLQSLTTPSRHEVPEEVSDRKTSGGAK